MGCLPESFYQQDVITVARQLLGKRLFREVGGTLISGVIIEAEAYRGEEDLACHARHGKTQRTAVMYGPAGRAYVYFTYGMHWMLNAVCGGEGFPTAVLIRAVNPTHGLDFMAKQRKGRPQKEWVNGPAKICQAFKIDRQLNGANLCDKSSNLWIEDGTLLTDEAVIVTPRIGLGSTPEPWLSKPWRFFTSMKDVVNFGD
jgi:DNA-3-methyladenine glycosylase